MSAIWASVQIPDDTTIAALPFGLDTVLISAYSLGVVKGGKSSLLVVNTDDRDVEVKSGKQIASYEVIRKEEAAIEAVNAVLALGDTDDCVGIDDNLSEKQADDLRELLAN